MLNQKTELSILIVCLTLINLPQIKPVAIVNKAFAQEYAHVYVMLQNEAKVDKPQDVRSQQNFEGSWLQSSSCSGIPSCEVAVVSVLVKVWLLPSGQLL
jgi:hypothetical protein